MEHIVIDTSSILAGFQFDGTTTYYISPLAADEIRRGSKKDELDGLIEREVLNNMRRSSVLVNLARPGLVDMPALLNALRSERISAAYVSRVEGLGVIGRLRASRTRNLFLTHDREAHVAEKGRFAFEQFRRMLDSLSRSEPMPNRIA